VPTITGLRAPRRGSKLRLIELDGEPWRGASSEAIAKAGLAEGDEVTTDELDRALGEADPACARERALRLLSYKDRSSSGLRARLEDDGYPAAIAREVVADLERIGLVDDARYAASYARNLVEIRRFGRSRALREMTSAGIPAEVAGEALDDVLDADAEAATAAALATVAARRSGATVDKVAARLLRRGYSPRIALAAARDAIESAPAADSDDSWPDAF